MFDVWESRDDGRKGLTYVKFATDFEKICEAHRASGRALAFAIILYELENPNVICSCLLRNLTY